MWSSTCCVSSVIARRRISIRSHRSGKCGEPSDPKATSSPSNVARELGASLRVRRAGQVPAIVRLYIPCPELPDTAVDELYSGEPAYEGVAANGLHGDAQHLRGLGNGEQAVNDGCGLSTCGHAS